MGQDGLFPEKISRLVPSESCMSDRIRSGSAFLFNHSIVSLTLPIGPSTAAEGGRLKHGSGMEIPSP